MWLVWLQKRGIIEEWNQTYNNTHTRCIKCVYFIHFALKQCFSATMRQTNNVRKQMSSQFKRIVLWVSVSVHARVSDLMANFLYHWICLLFAACVCDYFNSLEWNLNFWRREICEIFRIGCVLVLLCFLYVGEPYKYVDKCEANMKQKRNTLIKINLDEWQTKSSSSARIRTRTNVNAQYQNCPVFIIGVVCAILSSCLYAH